MRKSLLLLMAALLLAACAGGNQGQRERQQTMDQWQSLLRWSEYGALANHIHPDWLADNPIRDLDLERLRQFRVTEYRVQQVTSDPDGMAVERQVRIRMYHVHTARERVIEHREVWRYDEQRERWLLHSGLPDPRRRT
ncbi:hypothetical protein [Wenzhouxiangella sp. EGI_FJ10409]|uniref:hypothetical protein n=1 Tax=Wenzhouxiangella sp. EGI_FJ10409 TaxID=3243767 RepID=UPI0035DC66CF